MDNEHDSPDHPCLDLGRSAADLASQPELGLWPERIVGRRSGRSVDPVADGANLAGQSAHRDSLVVLSAAFLSGWLIRRGRSVRYLRQTRAIACNYFVGRVVEDHLPRQLL